MRGGGPVLSGSLGGPLSQWPLQPIRLQEVFDTVEAEVEPFVGMVPTRSLMGFVRPADWGVHADRLFGQGVATSPVLAPRDAATSLPVVREEAATSPALVSPALAWLADFRSPDPCSSSDEEAQGRRRWKGLT